MSSRLSGADDSKMVPPFRVDHHEEPSFVRDAIRAAPVFRLGMVRVQKGQCHWIRKHGDGLIERDAVLSHVSFGFLIVPLELKHNIVTGICNDRKTEIRRPFRMTSIAS
jgi:hypothetical protein